ncbi:glycosyltransferase group 1 family protein [Candidatus Omnitrophus magneticus]|uniref:Glycosyltransferase group 1 family protein n=1 Tax=Candidatus Omnitrophus magneticus TaxID=1609969 RepID=A0A0F0CPL6_9BACT|nr:glycosyltransferase group 1 family protein [Candidatus Omnitrophus magneticus]
MDKTIKIAIVHDWLTGMRGGEKCLEVLCELFPSADLFTLLHKKNSVSKTIENMKIKTSFLQNIPGITKSYRNFLPLFPIAIEKFDLRGYDLILSSSHAVAKGVRINSKALHISYCYTPARYAWQFFDDYFSKENFIKKFFISLVIKNLKKWDLKSNEKVTEFIAISHYIKNRIKKYYNRNSTVIYPPVDTDFPLASAKDSQQIKINDKPYYLMVSALVPYKRVDLAIKAFNENKKQLVIIGSGNEFNKLKSMARDNIKFLGWLGDETLREYYTNARALIFPGEEDFGIVPLEAQAYGKPVIAYASGGALETIIPFEELDDARKKENITNYIPKDIHGPTGVFFYSQTVPQLNKAIETFEANIKQFKPENARENALKFNRSRFKTEIKNFIEEKWLEHSTGTSAKIGGLQNTVKK